MSQSVERLPEKTSDTAYWLLSHWTKAMEGYAFAVGLGTGTSEGRTTVLVSGIVGLVNLLVDAKVLSRSLGKGENGSD